MLEWAWDKSCVGHGASKLYSIMLSLDTGTVLSVTCSLDLPFSYHNIAGRVDSVFSLSFKVSYCNNICWRESRCALQPIKTAHQSACWASTQEAHRTQNVDCGLRDTKWCVHKHIKRSHRTRKGHDVRLWHIDLCMCNMMWEQQEQQQLSSHPLIKVQVCIEYHMGMRKVHGQVAGACTHIHCVYACTVWVQVLTCVDFEPICSNWHLAVNTLWTVLPMSNEEDVAKNEF